jgi:hypothetical protein
VLCFGSEYSGSEYRKQCERSLLILIFKFPCLLSALSLVLIRQDICERETILVINSISAPIEIPLTGIKYRPMVDFQD